MFSVKVVNQAEVEKLLTMEAAIAAVEAAYCLKSEGRAALFPVVNHEFVPGVADMDIKSGDLSGAGIYGLKLVSWFSQNGQYDLPPLIGTILVFDSATGVPKGLINATGMTGVRTGAAGAVGSKHLARKDAQTLMMVGVGGQMPYQVLSHLEVADGLARVLLYDPLDGARAENAEKQLKARLANMIGTMYGESAHGEQLLARLDALSLEAVASADAASEADILVTVTPARKPVVPDRAVRPGTHLSCVGADMQGKQEVDSHIAARARLFADDLRQSLSIGELEIPLAQGLIAREQVTEIGRVIAGAAAGRTSPSDVTLFDSSGIAIQDLIVAKAVLEAADARGMGTVIDL